MNILEKFNQTIGFTKTESRVVLFLVIAFVVGIGIKFYKSSVLQEKKFDYTALDSEFAARSNNIQNDDSTGRLIGSNMVVDSSSAVNDGIDGEKIDLNTATAKELISLPGIGETMAERIIRYRSEHGVFRSLNDLTKVKGIGKKKLEHLAPFLTVGK